MNILIGKIGKSIKFKDLKINTGDDSSMILYSTMSRMFPEHNFYFCGPNDLPKLSEDERNYLFPNHNVFSVYEKPRVIGYLKDGTDELLSYEPTVESILAKGIKFDFALMFTGYVGNHTICNCCKKSDGSYYIIMNAFKRYAGPYIHVLNRLQIPLYTIVEDPRYVTINTEDFFARESLVLTQMVDCDIKVKQKFITSYEDHTHIVNKTIPCTYAEVEKIFLMAVDKCWRDSIDIQRKINNHKNPKCIIISNGHGTNAINSGGTVHNGRLQGYLEYVVNGLKDTPYSNTRIYGKWDEPVTTDYKQFEDRKLIDLSDEIADAKYTLVYSIVKDFVTIKPYEMIIKGIIPFIHPDYDSNRLLKLPEYLYVKSPEDFASKMMELDSDNDKYTELLNECFDCIKPEYLDGSHVVNTIMRKISDDLNIKYDNHAGVEPILNHFNKQIFDYAKLK